MNTKSFINKYDTRESVAVNCAMMYCWNCWLFKTSSPLYSCANGGLCDDAINYGYAYLRMTEKNITGNDIHSTY